MRTKRFLLVTAALTTAAASTTACGKTPATPDQKDAEVLPLPANPKGSFYDAGVHPTPTAETETPDASNPKPPPIADAGLPIRPHLPANPKGSFYDAGRKKPSDPAGY
jgi:hypothetical protein